MNAPLTRQLRRESDPRSTLTLVVREGPDKGARTEQSDSTLTVGSAERNSLLVLPLPIDLISGLMKKGESYEKKGLAQFDKLKAKVEGVAESAKDRAGEAWGRVEDKVEDVEDKLDDRVAVVLRKLGVPSKNEISTLTRRVEELTLLVEKKLKPTRKAAKRATPATRKTTTARRKR